MIKVKSNLIKNIHSESLATLAALEGLLPVVETFIVLLEVAHLVKHFITLVALELAHVRLERWHRLGRALAPLRTVAFFDRPQATANPDAAVGGVDADSLGGATATPDGRHIAGYVCVGDGLVDVGRRGACDLVTGVV